jgi:hypothetical protein
MYSPRFVRAIYLLCDYYLIIEVTVKRQSNMAVRTTEMSLCPTNATLENRQIQRLVVTSTILVKKCSAECSADNSRVFLGKIYTYHRSSSRLNADSYLIWSIVSCLKSVVMVIDFNK